MWCMQGEMSEEGDCVTVFVIVIKPCQYSVFMLIAGRAFYAQPHAEEVCRQGGAWVRRVGKTPARLVLFI